MPPPLPCPACGHTGPTRVAWEPDLEHGGGRLAYRHEQLQTVCYPLECRETYRLRCSSCAGEIRVTLVVSPGQVGGGAAREMACACGARWRLEQVGRLNVYLAEVA